MRASSQLCGKVLTRILRFSDPLSDELHVSQLVAKAASDFLSSCPTERYLLVSQPNLNIVHLSSSTAAPRLQAALSSSKVQGRMTISEMSGTVDLEQIASSIKENCRTAGKTPSLETVNLDPIPTSTTPTSSGFQELVESLRKSDEDLGLVLQQYDAAGDFTVIFTGTGPTEKEGDAEHKIYEPEFKDTTHQELKRQVGSVVRRQKERDTRPLFEKYQFFTPGKFLVGS